MIKTLLDFIDKNIVYIAILICLLALWMIHAKSTENEKEYLTNTETSSETFSEIVKQKKKLNFRCTVDGTNYYLAFLPISECEKQNVDCFTSAIVLIPEDTINAQLDTYTKTVKSNIDICNTTFKIKCLNNLSKPTEEEINDCSQPLNKCNIDRFFIHDFNVSEVNNVNNDSNNSNDNLTAKKYLFRGTSTPNLDNSTTPTMLNQHLVYNKGVSVLCGDTYAYGGKSPKEYAEVIVSMVPTVPIVSEETSIVGSEASIAPIKVQLLFNTQSILVGKDKNTGFPIYTPWPPNNPTKAHTYVGICKDTISNTYICKSGNFPYKRVCIVSSNEKALGEKTVLEFEPILVN